MRGKRKRFWIEIVVLGTAIACAVALLMATLGAAAGVGGGDSEPAQAATRRSAPEPPLTQQAVPQVSQQQTYEGMVTCSRCGAKHSPTIAKAASDCVLVCVHGGAQFALIDGNSMYILEGDPEGLKKVAGERAKITGAMNGNTINVSSVAAGS